MIAGLRIVALAIGMAALGARAQVPDDTLTATVLQRLAQEPVRACAMVAVVAERTRVMYACGKETAAADPRRDSIWEIGSLSKVFAGLLLADMARRGEVSIDDRAAKYAPKGARLPQRDGREIALRHLVSHTASLPMMPPDVSPPDFIRQSMAEGRAPLYRSLAATALERPIGGDAVYSNLGYLWLSDILGEAGGKRYDRLLAERVLRPLGMKDTAVVLDAEQAKRRVPGHDRQYRPVPPFEFPPALAGAAGLNASMEDLIRYAAAMTGRVETPLAESIAQSLSPLHAMGNGSAMASGWFLAQRPTGRIAFHDGEAGGSYAAMALNLATRTAAIVLVDAPVVLDDLAVHLVDPTSPLRRPPAADAKAAPPPGPPFVNPGLVRP